MVLACNVSANKRDFGNNQKLTQYGIINRERGTMTIKGPSNRVDFLALMLEVIDAFP
jgi:hypothetical protein